ncbi:hypothetical protein Terro_3550 [Terriglobus roseus DSM 18391]|uniref:Uncharacterized protein n=1 Tax=Terriglobus roseus (strain DSM 18391 / NRRL B-41598 / KBS 63) TaxID=926566 RepID=I3ZKJ6_TERRK|nr:hypothetical protein [Terriglobus roseus]AFL89764.1 hypothetical protein Terro_3550 [Terriglobus roseus DSM 18391]
MNELPSTKYVEVEKKESPLLLVTAIAAVVLALGGLIWSFLLQGRLTKAEQQLASQQQEANSLQSRVNASDARARAASETFAQRLGTTQAQLDARTQTILAKQQADAARLTNSQQAAEQRFNSEVSAVKTDVGSVKTDLGSTKTDVGSVKADLADTKTQLQRTMGDAGVMSGLIARNSTELEELKHKGDRTYYEFTLQKNAPPTLLSSVKLQLKKVDVKKGKFTLALNADDRVVEKKDKTLLEPVQFYSGKSPALFEIVVNGVDKNMVRGYLSVPKGM